MSQPEQLVHRPTASYRYCASVRVASVGFRREGGRRMSQERIAGLKDGWLWLAVVDLHVSGLPLLEWALCSAQHWLQLHGRAGAGRRRGRGVSRRNVVDDRLGALTFVSPVFRVCSGSSWVVLLLDYRRP